MSRNGIAGPSLLDIAQVPVGVFQQHLKSGIYVLSTATGTGNSKGSKVPISNNTFFRKMDRH